MNSLSAQSQTLRAEIDRHRAELLLVLERYGAVNPRVFGSVAREDATASSDVDLIVDLTPMQGNPLMRVAGIGEEFGRLLGVRVDVVTEGLLREPVAATARADAVPL
ncbi:nucleotidyltransferase family protein [Plantibacter sp. Mn2098]|uniref:nucleotidyltransferase family protein n=1 Tax=Plantibacter sp. Mn2098 TaxID=3395266 RepID=UPI003BC0C60A